MNRDADAKSLDLHDRRIVDRNIRKGLTTRKDYDKWLKSLPDVADKALVRDAAGDKADGNK